MTSLGHSDQGHIAQTDYSEKWPVTSMAARSLHRWKEGSR